MKVLNIPQNSEVEQYADLKYDRATNKYNSRPFWDVAAKFPQNLIDVTDEQSPRWGNAFYIEGENGMLELDKENWDTSG